MVADWTRNLIMLKPSFLITCPMPTIASDLDEKWQGSVSSAKCSENKNKLIHPFKVTINFMLISNTNAVAYFFDPFF